MHGQLLRSFLTVLHVLLRGRSWVDTIPTGNEYSFTHRIPMDTGKERLVVFRCKQYRHITHYARWYIPRRIHYTYTVEMAKVDDDEYTDYHMGVYPQLCSRYLNKTTYPLRCAINAHLDMLNKYNSS